MSSDFLATSHRPIPLRFRADLEYVAAEEAQFSGWVVKDPISLEYHQLEAVQHAVLCRLDGRVSLHRLQKELNQHAPTHAWTLAELQHLIIDLHRKGLVISERPGQDVILRQRRWERRRQRLTRMAGQFLFARFPGWNPNRFLEAMLPWVRWIYHPLTIVAATILVVSSWLLILVEFTEFRRRLPGFQQFFGWSNLPLLWGTLAVTKVFHEFGHGLTCHYFGRRCHEMGLMLLLFAPTLYCDTTDSWMLRPRWPRIWIGAGGMLFEIVLSALATYLWWWSQPGLVNHLALNVVFVCAVTTVIFNANPLMRYDGYYILSDWLGIANLRSKANRLLDRLIARWVYGRQPPADPLLPQHHETWFAAYALAMTTYSWFLMGSILLFLYSWLKPYQLQSLGIALAIFSLGGLLFSLGWRFWRIGRTPHYGIIHWGRIAVVSLLLLGSIIGLLWIPIPWYVEAAVVIEPTQSLQLLNTVPGRIRAIHVKPGNEIAAGDLLLELENEEIEDRLNSLEMEYAAQLATVAAARTRQQATDHAVASERLAGLKERLADARGQQQQLLILAPVAGRIVAPEERLAHPDLGDQRLETWHATPLDPRNLGSWLDVRTVVAEIAPDSRWTAVLYLPQAYRNEVTIGDAVSLKINALPHLTIRGRLSFISAEHAEIVPSSLSNKFGGSLTTVTLPDQQEHLSDFAYRGEVVLDDHDLSLRTGLRGSARFLLSNHTAGWWISQTFRRTFRFSL